MVLDNRKDLLIRISGGDNITVTYFEGLNVLVRIPGTSNVPGAILVSAHFDSVSTAYGATVSTPLLGRYKLTVGRRHGYSDSYGIGSLFR